MKIIFKCILLILFAISPLFSNVFAFQNGEWLTIKDYEQRKGYEIDRSEFCEYIVKLYDYMTWKKAEPIENIFQDIDAETYPYVLNAYSLGFVGGTSENTFSPQDTVTRGQIAQMIYNLVHKMYPNLDLSGGEGIVFPDYVEEWNVKSLQFVYSRGIMSCKDSNRICPFDLVTLGQAVQLLDNTMRKDPTNYSIIHPRLNTNHAYLTFDDVTSQNTSSILDTLKMYNIQATFFITGMADEKLLRRIKNEGHIVGNHNSTHDYSKIYANTKEFWDDFISEEEYLERHLGYKPTLMRFPGGSNNTVSKKYGGDRLMDRLVKEATEYGYTYFDWNVDSQDATGINIPKKQIVDNVLNGARNKTNAIVLLHESVGKETTAEALLEIIEGLSNMGFSFNILTESSYCVKFK